MVRMGALVLFLILALAVHGHGSADSSVHALYLVVIAAVLVASLVGRGRRRGRYGPRGSGFGRGSSFGSGPTGLDMRAENPDPEAGP
jgi:hypothetical protein